MGWKRFNLMMLLAIAPAGCATTAPPTRAAPIAMVPAATATAAETEFLCAILPQHIERLGDMSESAVPFDHMRVQALMSRIRLSAAARLPQCPAGTPPIFWNYRYIDGFGLNPEGTLGMISGGWQSGTLTGATGACYFEHGGAGWRLLGCILTGIS
jgi:hypothetical protein